MLKQRVISAVIAILILAVAVYFLPAAELRWIVLAIWTLGAWEWSGFLQNPDLKVRIAYTIVVFFPMLFIAFNQLPSEFISWILISGLLFWIVALIQIMRFPKPISNLFIVVSGILVLIPSYCAFDYLLKIHGLAHVFLLLLMIWAADVGAYFTGKKFGKNKLAINVSPGKTREGAVGGLVLALIITLLGAVFILGLPWSQALTSFVIIGIAVVASSIIGDLTVSIFKRNAGIKDSGVFLPGHGGVLDRVDSLCAGVVFFAVCLILFDPVFLAS